MVAIHFGFLIIEGYCTTHRRVAKDPEIGDAAGRSNIVHFLQRQVREAIYLCIVIGIDGIIGDCGISGVI